MQIIDRNGQTTIKLLGFEARLLRNARHLLSRAARNVTSQQDALTLMRASEGCKMLEERGTTPSQRKKLNDQDAQPVEVATEEDNLVRDHETGQVLAKVGGGVVQTGGEKS